MDNPNCVIVSIDQYKQYVRQEAILSLIYDICQIDTYESDKVRQILHLMAVYDADNPIEVKAHGRN